MKTTRYLNHLTRSKQAWQIKQAREAIRLFQYFQTRPKVSEGETAKPGIQRPATFSGLAWISILEVSHYRYGVVLAVTFYIQRNIYRSTVESHPKTSHSSKRTSKATKTRCPAIRYYQAGFSAYASVWFCYPSYRKQKRHLNSAGSVRAL